MRCPSKCGQMWTNVHTPLSLFVHKCWSEKYRVSEKKVSIYKENPIYAARESETKKGCGHLSTKCPHPQQTPRRNNHVTRSRRSAKTIGTATERQVADHLAQVLDDDRI